MSDLIDRQAAIDALIKNLPDGCRGKATHIILALPSAQLAQNLHSACTDTISRQAAIDALADYIKNVDKVYSTGKLSADDCKDAAHSVLDDLPAAQSTLYGYNIKHLDLIARVLQKENLPPDRITEAITDIGRVVAIVCDEFEKTLRRSVEQGWCGADMRGGEQDE